MYSAAFMLEPGTYDERFHALDALMEEAALDTPGYLEAKSQYTRWYKGFHIVISQVLRSYGDGTMAHITPNQRKTA